MICISVAGPEYWGRLNPEWGLCNKGRRQSPINVDPNKLLFDPFLPALDINKETVRLYFSVSTDVSILKIYTFFFNKWRRRDATVATYNSF